MDFVDTYMEYTAERPSPALFRKWAAITTLGGSLERRIWTLTKGGHQHANLYTMLVGGPGVGKSQAIGPAAKLLKATKKFAVAPNNVSRASFVDALAKVAQSRLKPDKSGTFTYHHLFVFAAELGVFLSEHDLQFLSIINELFDNTDSYREEKRHSLKEPISIPNPLTTLLLGSQPGFLSAILPETAWTMGWTSRMLMIYATKAPRVPIFGKYKDMTPLEDKLISKLTDCADYYGEILWDGPAIQELERLDECGCPPIPDHPKLANYNPRRTSVFLIKLAMISAMARGEELAVRLQDVERARGWLLEIEELMPQIFRDMVFRSDDQVIEETFQFTFGVYVKSRVPVPAATILRFLSQRAPADKAKGILNLMQEAGMLQRQAGTDNYIPRARELHGME